MALTIEFLYEDGEPVKALDDEVLDENKMLSILKLRVHDIISLGSGSKKQDYRVIKINHQMRAGSISDSGEEEAYHEFIVKAITGTE